MVAHKIVQAFVTIYRAAYGWKAVYLVWDDEMEMHEPHDTSYFQYPTPKEAYYDAEVLATVYGVEFQKVEGFRPARNQKCRRLVPGWYRCPNVACNHAFMWKVQPNSCPQCGYEE